MDSAIVDQVIANATIKYPPVLVESEAEDDFKYLLDRLEQRGITLEDYLKGVNKTKAEYLAELNETAAKRVEIGISNLPECARSPHQKIP